MFDGVRIDTGCSRSLAISIGQYRSYCSIFHAPMQISKQGIRTLSGLGGKAVTIGTATIPIPFKKLGVIANVKFQIVEPSLLSTQDMHQSGLYVNIQQKCMTYNGNKHPLSFENYCLIHRWENKYSSCIQKTKLENFTDHSAIPVLANQSKRCGIRDPLR